MTVLSSNKYSEGLSSPGTCMCKVHYAGTMARGKAGHGLGVFEAIMTERAGLAWYMQEVV